MGSNTYSDDFNRDAIAQIAERGFPVKEASYRLGVSAYPLTLGRRSSRICCQVTLTRRPRTDGCSNRSGFRRSATFSSGEDQKTAWGTAQSRDHFLAGSTANASQGAFSDDGRRCCRLI